VFECNLCHCSFLSEKGLHSHLTRKEKILKSDYYHTFYPRVDLYTKQLLKFKDREQYFNSFFNSKDNLVNWFRENYNTSEAKQIALEILRYRKESKNLVFAPSQVELRTIDSPTILGLEKIYGSYDAPCVTLNLKRRFGYGDIKLLPAKKIKVIIDTREQDPMPFENSKVQKIDVGDYTAGDPDYSDVHIERKSQSDFFGTFYSPQNFERFIKEIERAKEFGVYLIVVVERGIDNCLNYKSFFTKDENVTNHTFYNVRQVMQKYDNCQFVFCRNRDLAREMILTILSQGESAKKLDWQYLVDKRII